MSNLFIAFLAGCFLGGLCGVGILALCAAAKCGDELPAQSLEDNRGEI